MVQLRKLAVLSGYCTPVGLKMAIFDQKVVKMATRPDFFFHIRKQHISAHLTDFEPPSSKNVYKT